MKHAARKTALAILLLATLNASITAQLPDLDTPPDAAYDTFHNALGMYVNSFAGDPAGGLHYQHWADRFGYQITVGAFYSPQEKYSRTLDYSIAVDGLWTVYGNTFSKQLAGRLYVWAEAGHRGYISSDDYAQDENLENKTLVLNEILGAGIGIETILYEHFSIPFQFGYTGEFPTNPKVTFSISGGIRYRY